MITTGEFEVKGGKMMLSLVLSHGKWWLIGDALIAGILVVAAILTSDIRYAILALMLVLILTPMMVAMLYTVHGTRRFTALNCQPHVVAFGDRDLTVTVFPRKRDDEEEEPHGRSIGVPYGDIRQVSVSDMMLRISIGGEGTLLVPLRDFTSQDEALAALKAMRTRDSATQPVNE